MTPRLLVTDLELAPNVVHAWRLFDEDTPLDRLIVPTRILCWSAKWVGDKTIYFRSEFHDTPEVMIRDIHALLDEADAVIGYNSRKFDVQHYNRAMAGFGLNPPSPFKQIDLYETVKRRFNFPSGKLNYVAQELGIGKKVAHEGHKLWIKCMAGDTKAWAKMRRYNIGDVKLTEALYIRLRPWIDHHPNLSVFVGGTSCPACGASKLQSRGQAVTNAAIYQRYQCQQCGKWSRGSKGQPVSDVRDLVG